MERAATFATLLGNTTFGWLLCFALVADLYVGGTRHHLHAAEKLSEGVWVRRGPAQLELGLTGTGEDQVLSITLRNISERPFAVDRDLVFNVYIDRYFTDQKQQSPKILEKAAKPDLTKSGWLKRFAPLQPGETVTREIRPQQRFCTFSFGRGLAPEMIFAGQAYWKAFPNDDRIPVEYEVWIQGSMGFWNVLAAYTGLGEDTPDIYDGPIGTRIKVDKGQLNGTGCVGESRRKVANERVVRGKT